MDDVSTPSPWQATRFEIRTTLEPLDYLHLMTVLRWSGIERVVSWLAAVGMSGIGAIAAFIASEPFVRRLPVYPYWDWGLAIAIAGALAAFVIYKVFVMGPYVDSMFYGQPVGMGETTIVADLKGVSATSAGVEVRMPWDKVLDVIVANEHLFLMFGRLCGVIVPRRAFADDAEAQRFADFVRSKTQKP
ncbi:MAG: YcxB family protein, partial [Burkholderiales bacterium]